LPRPLVSRPTTVPVLVLVTGAITGPITRFTTRLTRRPIRALGLRGPVVARAAYSRRSGRRPCPAGFRTRATDARRPPAEEVFASRAASLAPLDGGPASDFLRRPRRCSRRRRAPAGTSTATDGTRGAQHTRGSATAAHAGPGTSSIGSIGAIGGIPSVHARAYPAQGRGRAATITGTGRRSSRCLFDGLPSSLSSRRNRGM
jgi:hypothetical protein